jgi:hypothetical protein
MVTPSRAARRVVRVGRFPLIPEASMLIDIVREALDAEGWSYEVVTERGACVMSVSGRSTSYRCIAAADEALEQVAVLVVAPQRLPEATRVAVCEYLMRVNFGLRIGSFDLDFSDGEFRFRTALDIEGGSSCRAWCRRCSATRSPRWTSITTARCAWPSAARR